MIHPNEYFDAIYCLNLDRRIARWQQLALRLARWGIRAERFPAVDGTHAEIEMQHRHLRSLSRRLGGGALWYSLPNAAALGCLLSHIKILHDARQRDHARILVLEDDIRLHHRFLSEFEKVRELPCDWKLLYLGASQYQWRCLRRYSESFYCAKNSQGTFAVGIARPLYGPLLKLLERQQCVADRCFTAVQSRHDGECFVFVPNLAIADVTESDIRPGRNRYQHAGRMRWDLRLYERAMAAW